jgi:hypothetical protein
MLEKKNNKNLSVGLLFATQLSSKAIKQQSS